MKRYLVVRGSYEGFDGDAEWVPRFIPEGLFANGTSAIDESIGEQPDGDLDAATATATPSPDAKPEP